MIFPDLVLGRSSVKMMVWGRLIGPIFLATWPRTIIFTDDLPKTRSGKIMRRLLRDVAEGRELGDTTTLADPSVVDEIRNRASAAPQEG